MNFSTNIIQPDMLQNPYKTTQHRPDEMWAKKERAAFQTT